MEVRYLGNGFFEVSSETHGTDDHYNVNLSINPPECPCPNAILGGNQNCKHVKRAREYAKEIGYDSNTN